MKDNIELKYKPKWDWKMTILLVITSVVFQGCKMLMESAKLWTFNSELWTYAGIIILMVGIIDTMIEAYMGLGLFYGKSQRGGANANSGIICALGITLISSNFLFSICLIVVISLIVGGIRYFISVKQYEKANKYVGKVGVAKNDISYKGIGEFEGEILNVRITHDKIKKGDAIKIETIDGFHLIVEKFDN